MILTGTTVTDNSGKIILRESGSVVNATVLSRDTEVSLSSSSNGVHWTTSYTKLYGSATNLIVLPKISMANCYNGNCGHYISVGGVVKYGFDYVYDSWCQSDNRVHFTATWTGLSAGANTIIMGWQPADGGSNLPSYYENPVQGRTDGRRRANGSRVAIWEVVA
jgi:hypothetical protein